MARIVGINGIELKLLGILVAFALIPMISLGIISLLEMDQASVDVQNNISSLSTSLNRSALTVAPDDADQVQLAAAKARQYDEFFRRIGSDNELIAGYVATNSENESCTAPAGIWVAPTGSNQTTSERRSATIRSLCTPARIMQSLLKTDPSISLSYIGTEDGVLATWPYSNETISNTAPFSYRDKPYYAAAKSEKKTIWTGPYIDGRGLPMVTITTPIYRGREFIGIAGMDVSMQSIYLDLTSIRGRGYPFIIDGTRKILFRPASRPEGALRNLFQSDNLSDASIPDAELLAQGMLKGSSGSIVIGLGGADGYVAFSPIATLGWSLGIAYPAEEMSVPARFIDSGIRDVANSATRGLNDASGKTRNYALLIFALTATAAVALGLLLSRRIDGQIGSLVEAAERVSRGDFEIDLKSSGELAYLNTAFCRMARDLKDYTARIEGVAEERGGSGTESALLRGVKRNLVPPEIPRREGYQILALYQPSEKNRFDLFDIMEAGDKVALATAGVGGDGIQAAMLAIMSRTLIRAAPDKMDPSKAMAELNLQINKYAQGMNLACFYALLDPAAHSLEYVNAGFNPPFIVDGGGMVDTLGGGGIALGMLDRIEMQTERIPLQQGDVMAMYSNGVIEAENSQGRQFGIERLIDLIIRHRARPASEILGAVEEDLQGFSRDRTPKADVTLVILKRD
jgi:sigma-B regulation protein RsbU (phosphoserine phosphatase)